ncbi:hypothetical protein LCGC14_1992010, partial [marine sediment metagenome]
PRKLCQGQSYGRPLGIGGIGSGTSFNNNFLALKRYKLKMKLIGEDFIPDTLDMDVVDKFYTVTDEQAFLTTREVVRKEGLLIGGSGGAAVHVVKQISKNLKNDDVVVVITPDGSQKYYW